MTKVKCIIKVRKFSIGKHLYISLCISTNKYAIQRINSLFSFKRLYLYSIK